MFQKFIKFLWFFVFPGLLGRKHQLEITDDDRGYIPISTFGFYRNGILKVQVDKFQIRPYNIVDKVGFSLEKTSNPYVDQHLERCQLDNFKQNDLMVQHVFFLFDLPNKQVKLKCSQDMKNLHVFIDERQIEFYARSGHLEKMGDSFLFSKSANTDRLSKTRMKREIKESDMKSNSTFVANQSSVVVQESQSHSSDTNNFECENVILNMSLQGTYYNFTVEERNPDDNYLSAGEMPLPALYFMMSFLFFLSAVFWFYILKKSREPVFKIHYLMGLVIIIKGLSLMFHAINYHYIQIKGIHMEAWAVMFYIMHLLKGALLFTVLALIGSGWAFIKHVLSSKEKKIFMIVIPLQIIANVATIILEETEESNSERHIWAQLLYLIDFLCCGAILLPIVWSIRHLQEASQTDGKAAINLEKLKLFRHFYMMIVCYIYFTRIIVYLLRITVPFQYEWIDDMFHEMATFVFFVLTGYKFKPASNNPYFKVDDDEEMDEVLTTTGLTETVSRVNRKPKKNPQIVEVFEDEEEINLLGESSLVYD